MRSAFATPDPRDVAPDAPDALYEWCDDDDSLCIEVDSPTFTPSALDEFEARGFERRNR